MGQLVTVSDSSLTTLAENFLKEDAVWREYGIRTEKGRLALEEANALLRRASGDDIHSIATENPWGLGYDKTVRNLKSKQEILETIHFQRSQEKGMVST